MLTVAKLSRWSINYYNDTARAAGAAAGDARRAGGGLGDYYAEHDTRSPVWLCAGDTHSVAKLVGLTDVQRAGGTADPDVVQRWLDEGTAPNGAAGRAFGKRGVHGFDLTFCAPKSVSLIRALRAGDVADKAIGDAHAAAVSEALEYLAVHAGYTRVHNPVTGEKDLARLPGLVAIAYQHETSRAGDPHLHTHVSSPTGRPAPMASWCRLMARRCITKPKPPGLSTKPRCAANSTSLWALSGCRWTPPPAWPKSPASRPKASAPGPNAPPSCVSGRPEILPSRTARTSRPHSWAPPKKPPARPNRNNFHSPRYGPTGAR
jgi:hypothetical protein